MRRRMSLILAITLGLAVAAAVWFGAGTIWRWLLAMHHIH